MWVGCGCCGGKCISLHAVGVAIGFVGAKLVGAMGVLKGICCLLHILPQLSMAACGV